MVSKGGSTVSDRVPESSLPTPHRPYVVGIEKPNMHGITVREHIASFRDRADALVFREAYNGKYTTGSYYRADLWELRYVQ